MHHCSRGVLSAGLGALRRGCTVPAVGGAWQAVEQRTNLNMSNMYVKPYDLTNEKQAIRRCQTLQYRSY